LGWGESKRSDFLHRDDQKCESRSIYDNALSHKRKGVIEELLSGVDDQLPYATAGSKF
jgi:hypothetical protein